MSTPIPLWSDDIPVKQIQPWEGTINEEFICNVKTPEIVPYLAKENNASGTGVLIFPGGAYVNLA